MPQWLVIGISGVTCGGKTTLAHGLHDYFKGLHGAPLWNTPYTIGEVRLISQDDYFLPVEDRRHKWIEKLNCINFELITSLDMKKMLADIAQIIRGRPEQQLQQQQQQQQQVEQLVEYMPAAPAGYANFEHYALQFQQQYQQQQQQQQFNSNFYQHSNGKHQPQSISYQYQQPLRHHHPQLPPPPPHPHLQHQHRPHHRPQQQQQQQHGHAPAVAHIMRVNAQIAAQLRDKKINVLLIEGFMIFNQPELLALCNLKYHFHLPYEKCYERRSNRGYDPPDCTGYFELCVWPYYEKNFADYRDCKDITVLNGEIGKEKIFKFVLQRIVHYFEERCDGNAPPMSMPIAAAAVAAAPQKMFGMLGVGMGVAKSCPMEQ